MDSKSMVGTFADEQLDVAFTVASKMHVIAHHQIRHAETSHQHPFDEGRGRLASGQFVESQHAHLFDAESFESLEALGQGPISRGAVSGESTSAGAGRK